MTTSLPADPGQPVRPPGRATDVDLDLVADDRADALDPGTARALRELLGRDPAAAARYAEFAAALDGLAAVLAAEPAPVLPDAVAIRLDAALEREIDLRGDRGAPVAGAGALAASGGARPPARRPGRWRKALAGWGAAALGSAAVIGAIVAVVHGGSASSSTTSTAGSAAAAASSAAAPRAAAAATSGAGSGAAADSPADGRAQPAPTLLTARSLPAAVRALIPDPHRLVSAGTLMPSPAATAGASAQAKAAAPGALTPRLAGCRPAGVPTSTPVLAATDVTYAHGHAILVVFAGTPAPTAATPTGATPTPTSVRAYVVRVCGAKPLLSRTVALPR